MASSQALDLFRALPAKTRSKLNYADLEIMVGAVGIKDRIHEFYVRAAAEERALRIYKQKAGYCSGRPSCMAFVGKDSEFFACAPCRKYAREMAKRESGATKRALTEYGKMRKHDREQERAERERAG